MSTVRGIGIGIGIPIPIHTHTFYWHSTQKDGAGDFAELGGGKEWCTIECTLGCE